MRTRGAPGPQRQGVGGAPSMASGRAGHADSRPRRERAHRVAMVGRRAAPRRAANCFRLAGDRYLDPSGTLGEFANHGCRPNVRVVARGTKLAFEAIRPIRAGEEVLHDYATLLGADDVWTMRCRCGWPGCRGRVERFDRLPMRVIRDYQAMGAIPGYIVRTAAESTPSRR